MNKITPILLLFFCFNLFACKPDEDGTTTPEIPKLSIQDINRFEGNGQSVFQFKVRLNKASTETVEVDYQTLASSAEAQNDFIPTQGTLVFNPNDLEQSIDVEIVTDTFKEPDEQFEIVLSNAKNAQISRDKALGTIRNDDTHFNSSDGGYTTPLSYPGKTLVWNDEFEGPNLNLNDWTYEVGTGTWGWGNNELQYYRDGTSNAYIQDGKLIIEAKNDGFGGSNYTSARIKTQGKQKFTHGRVDIRAKLPKGQGIWPALWMLGENITTLGWPSCGEIDIMELVGHEPNKVHASAHFGPDPANRRFITGDYTLPGGKNFCDEFHVFTLIWEPTGLKFYVNDLLYKEIKPSEVAPDNYPFDLDHFFIFNVAVGGNWPGSPDHTTVFPQQMLVDYVRVFQ